MDEQTTRTDVQVSSPAAAPAQINKGSNVFLPISILIASVLIAGSIFYLVISMNKTQPGTAVTPPPPAEGAVPTLNENDVVLGDPNAKVTIIEYGDYQCPFCARLFTETEPLIREQYIKTGKVKMAFRSFQFLGPESIAAGEAAECAKEQNQFWAYHDAIYTAEAKDGQEHNGNLNRAFFLKIAGDLKLDTKAFASCFDTHKYATKVKNDATEASSKYGVNSTPTAFVNGERIVGAMPFDGEISAQLKPFKPVIEAELAK